MEVQPATSKGKSRRNTGTACASSKTLNMGESLFNLRKDLVEHIQQVNGAIITKIPSVTHLMEND
ncbi:hypothetical protein KIN20_029986 [Parelaphostrongylus tenuis]|uniref:Uncharacterized protein n=1 Tax=Parelaphostrongylus tenuis TaxID=148309 RepID=A0AAD5R3E5_PARTN|nr:hypothetical protein KIN20_029986 [Parelaphostrongylus tenuis]